MNQQTLRNWRNQADVDDGLKEGLTMTDSVEQNERARMQGVAELFGSAVSATTPGHAVE